MRTTSLFILCTLFALTTNAQSLQVSASAETAGNATSQFTVNGQTLRVNESGFVFGNQQVFGSSKAIAPNGIAATAGNGISIYDGGEEIASASYQPKANDNSLKVYAVGDGSVLIRENVANFLVYNTLGEAKESISNSSQSTEGESVSELAADPMFKTVVLYNPKIIRNGVEGSRAQLLTGNSSAESFYYDESRAIRMVEVSQNGQFIGVVNYSSGSDDAVTIFDRFGNRLNEITFDQEIAGVQLPNDGRYLTINSDGRAAAYSIMNGDRLGSTSVRGSSIRFAEYIPADETILLMAADASGSTLTNVELKAVNLDARKIASQDYPQSLGTTDILPLSLERTGRYSYTLSGLSQTLNIRASF